MFKYVYNIWIYQWISSYQILKCQILLSVSECCFRGFFLQQKSTKIKNICPKYFTNWSNPDKYTFLLRDNVMHAELKSCESVCESWKKQSCFVKMWTHIWEKTTRGFVVWVMFTFLPSAPHWRGLQEGKPHLLVFSEKRAGHHKPCHTDLITAPWHRWPSSGSRRYSVCNTDVTYQGFHSFHTSLRQKVGSTSSGR